MKSKALLGPAGNFRLVTGEVIGVSNQAFYRSLNDDELLQVLQKLVGTLQGASLRITQDLREHLLPALLVLRERHMQPGRRKPIPGRPTYYEVLASLNLKPDTVRKWFRPTASADAVLQLLGERGQRKWPRRSAVDESATQLLLAAADKIAAAVLDGKIDTATRLAHEYWEARKS
jgi:hypothetical protein